MTLARLGASLSLEGCIASNTSAAPVPTPEAARTVARIVAGRLVSPHPPWRHPRGKWMVSLVDSHTNATSQRWHLWEIDLRFAPGVPPGWGRVLLC